MLSFVRQLCEHTKPLRVLLAKDSNMTPTSFIETVVMQLVESLQSKSAQFKGRGDLKCIFLANNFSYIAKSIPHCPHDDEAELDAYLPGEIQGRIERLRDKAISQFVEGSYASFKEYLVDPKETLHYAKSGTLLTLESGRLLKEKFAVRSYSFLL
jgi:exocyst complex protein 7